MKNVEKKLNEEILKCNTKLSWRETLILEKSLDLSYILSTMFAKEEKSEQVKKLKNKLLNNTKMRVAK